VRVYRVGLCVCVYIYLLALNLCKKTNLKPHFLGTPHSFCDQIFFWGECFVTRWSSNQCKKNEVSIGSEFGPSKLPCFGFSSEIVRPKSAPTPAPCPAPWPADLRRSPDESEDAMSGAEATIIHLCNCKPKVQGNLNTSVTCSLWQSYFWR